jgi:hypothetical protein
MKNNIDYKTDVSFFGYITVLDVSSFHETIVKWMETEPNSQFRLLVDKQADDDYVSFSAIQDLYPGIRVIATITNPWRRIVNIYTVLKRLNEDQELLDIIKNINFVNFTFESFLGQLKTDTGKWFTAATPQIEWIKGANDLLYIVRDDYIEEDFKVIQNYFKSDMPITVELTSYKEYYTEDTKKFVEELFKEDIERFDFKY